MYMPGRDVPASCETSCSGVLTAPHHALRAGTPDRTACEAHHAWCLRPCQVAKRDEEEHVRHALMPSRGSLLILSVIVNTSITLTRKP